MNTKTQNMEHIVNEQMPQKFKMIFKLFFIVLAIFYAMPGFSQTAPLPPISISANPTNVCPSSPYTFLKAVSPGNTIKWYNVSTGGTSLGSSASGSSFYINVNEPTTYFAESVSPTAVVSTSRTAVTVGVNTAPIITYMPADINATNQSGQCGTIVTYPSASAIGTPAPNIIYSDSSGSNFDGGSTTVIVSAVNVCATSSLSFDVTVNDIEYPGMIAPPMVAITAPLGYSTVSNLDLGLATATDNCGIMAIYNDAPAVFQAGTTVVTWTAIDYNGNRTTTTQTVNIIPNIINAAPVITSVTCSDPDNIVAQGSSVSLTTNWNDEENGGPYTVTINWGDGTAPTVLTGINSHTITVPHIYNKSGVFAPVITVTDGGNASDTQIYKYIVVYVSGNYATTAAGQFYAPPGSLVANPSLSTANLKVQLGDHCMPKPNSPGKFNGMLNLEMAGAHFVFETENTDYDYLVVSGCYLAQFHGTGYLYANGHKSNCHGGCHGACAAGGASNAHYGILVVQTDRTYNIANKNKVRIKIWNMDDANAVVFDTQMGDPDDALPTTPISSGNCNVRIPNSCVPRLLNPIYDNEKLSGDDALSFSTTATPNPFIEDLNLTFNSESVELIQVGIYDVVGKLVKTVTDVEPNSLISIQNNLSPGIYYVHATQGNNIRVTKVVKS